MTEADWDQIDKSSRCLLSCFLETKLSATSIGESHGNVCWDLSCCIRGKKVAVEIKDRGYPHDRFGDILVEESKQVDIGSKKAFDTALAVNVFNDRVLAVANLYDKDAKHFKKKAPATTLVKGADHTSIWKDFTSLPQRYKFKFTLVGAHWSFQRTV